MTSSDPQPNRRVLCIDDDPHVLEGIARTLSADFVLSTSSLPHEALGMLTSPGSFAVVVSDLRMPGLDGITLLDKARALAPDTVRVLLTGQAELADAVAAINRGGLFRFLTKPCPPEQLDVTLREACRQHELLVTERELLEDTLRGCLRAMTAALGAAAPAAFGRAERVARLAAQVARGIGCVDAWRVEAGVLLSAAATAALPAEVAARVNAGDVLSPAERAMIERLPAVLDDALRDIPRIADVRAAAAFTLAGIDAPRVRAPEQGAAPDALAALQAVIDLDALRARGFADDVALRMLVARDAYGGEVLAALGAHLAARSALPLTTVGRVADLPAGVELEDDLLDVDGLLVATRGQILGTGVRERLCNHAALRPLRLPIRVRG